MTPAEQQFLQERYENSTFPPLASNDGSTHLLEVHERLAAGGQSVVFSGKSISSLGRFANTGVRQGLGMVWYARARQYGTNSRFSVLLP
jgi:hypothetical protein